MNKKVSVFNIVDIIAGVIVTAGGILIIINYVNMGLLLTGLGAVFEAVKIVMQQGIK